MDNQLKCFLVLSLKEMALRRVAVLLWSGADILESVSKFQFDVLAYDNEAEQEAEWRDKTEDKIKDKMLKLDLPETLKEDLIQRIRPIGLDVRKWAESHRNYFYDFISGTNLLDLTKLCWTSTGTINDRKTAEELLSCDMLEIDRRYELACAYCFENDIPLLWHGLFADTKWAYENKIGCPYLPHCWPYILQGKLSELDYLMGAPNRYSLTFYQHAFEYSIDIGNKSAAGYFFLKLSHEEREDSLVRTVHTVLTAIRYIDPLNYPVEESKVKFSCLFFLLSLMNPEERMEVFASRPIEVLFSFLEWPWQDLFLENAGLFWTLLPPSSYGDLLRRMDLRYSKSEFYVPKLFQELFVQSSLGFKKWFVDEGPGRNYIPECQFTIRLFVNEDSETVGVIFRNLDAADRIKLLFHPNILELLFKCVLEDRWPMVHVCLGEVTLSEADKKRLKRSFVKFLERYSAEEKGHNSKRFLSLFDDSDGGFRSWKSKRVQARRMLSRKRHFV